MHRPSVPPGIIASALMLELLNALLILHQLKGAWSAIGYLAIELTSLSSILERADVAEDAPVAFALQEASGGKTMTQGVETRNVLATGSSGP